MLVFNVHAVTPERSPSSLVELLAMVIVAVGSVIGSWLGVAFIMLLTGKIIRCSHGCRPGGVSSHRDMAAVPYASTARSSSLPVVEPLAIGKRYGTSANTARWPFGYARDEELHVDAGRAVADNIR